MARIGKTGKKIAVLIASNVFVAVRKHCRSSFKRLHRPVFRKIGWQTCDCVNKCTVPLHLSNLDGCQLKCFGGSGDRFQHQNKSLTLNGALHAAFDWGARCIFIYPDFIQNSLFTKRGRRNDAISSSEVKKRLLEASGAHFN